MKKLPVGWKSRLLSDFVKSLDTGVSVNAEDIAADNSGIGILKLSCVSKGFFNPRENKNILSREVDRAKVTPQKGNILISRSNTKDLVGSSAYIEKDYPNLFLPDTLWQTNFHRNITFSSKWLSYVLQSPLIRKLLGNLASGTSASMKKLTKPTLLSLEILTPPKQEQLLIVNFLNCWDRAIGLTEKLIEAKINIKLGLMQQLLTGKKRFVEFESNSWQKLKLGEIANFINGMAFKPSDWKTSGIPIIRIQNLNGSKEFNYYQNTVDNKYYIKKGDLLFSWSGSKGTSFGPHIWQGSLGILNQHIFKIEIKAVIDQQFLYQALINITQEIETKAHGSAGLVHVTKGELEKHDLYFPANIEEQRRIADVLNSCDKEVDLLNKQLEAFKLQKRGLMQKLLTGQIRVKVDDPMSEGLVQI